MLYACSGFFSLFLFLQSEEESYMFVFSFFGEAKSIMLCILMKKKQTVGLTVFFWGVGLFISFLFFSMAFTPRSGHEVGMMSCNVYLFRY